MNSEDGPAAVAEIASAIELVSSVLLLSAGVGATIHSVLISVDVDNGG